jgi:hypothetical protein
MTVDPPQYGDDDLVYVDPETKTVVGKLEYGKNELPKSLPYKKEETSGERSWRKFYPWGTYRSMKRTFRLEGKVREEESGDTLDDVLPKLLNDTL